MADDILIFFIIFPMKLSLDISCELSAWQTIHMKCQDLFFVLKKKKKKKKKRFKMLSAANVIGPLKVNENANF